MTPLANDMQTFRGLLGMSDGGRGMLGAWGLMLDRFRERIWLAAKNRFSESGSSAVFYEFKLPNDARLLPDKWEHTRNRGTLFGLKNMLSKIGVSNFSIYGLGTRYDVGTIPEAAPATLTKYSAMSGYSTPWWTLVVWSAESFMPSASFRYYRFSDIKIGATTGYFTTSQAKPSTGVDSEMVAKIARYNEMLGHPCLEVYVCYAGGTDVAGVTADGMISSAGVRTAGRVSIRNVSTGVIDV